MARKFRELLEAQSAEKHFLCVGLDSDAGKLPILHLGLNRFGYSDQELLEAQDAYRAAEAAWESGEEAVLSEVHEKMLADAQLAFNKRIIDATKDFVAAYKPNSAFYEALGPAGMQALRATINYIHRVAPEVIVIIDFKRADIGNTNRGYVAAAAAADALTLNPYFGREAMEPFLKLKNKGLFFLCKTSNPGGGELQDLMVHSAGQYPTEPLYRRVARLITGEWDKHSNCCLVVGATKDAELANVREIVGDDVIILSPGLGTQGGNLRDAAIAGRTKSRHDGVLFNNASAILFASSDADFDVVAGEKAEENMRDIQLAMAA